MSRPPRHERWQLRAPLLVVGVGLSLLQWWFDRQRGGDPRRRRIRLERNLGTAAVDAWVIARYVRLHRR